MKAAVIQQFGDRPKYQDFKNPDKNEGDLVIQMIAIPLERFDKLTR